MNEAIYGVTVGTGLNPNKFGGGVSQEELKQVKEYLEMSIPYINKLYTVESYEDIVNLHNTLGVDELVVINVGEAFEIPIVRRSVSSGSFEHGQVFRLKFVDENGETYVNVLEIIDTVPIEDNAGHLMKYTIDYGEGNVTEHSVLALHRGGKDGESVTITNIKESTAANGTSVVTFSDGKTLSIKNGRNGASGNTPVKGVDYFTPTEIDEIVSKASKDAAELVDVPTKLSQLTDDSTHRVVTDTEKATWNAKSNFSGSYTDLTNKPTIPTVPTKVSAFTNDSGYLTSIPDEYVTDTELNAKGYLTQHQDLSSYAKKSEIPTVPTNVSEFTNDANYITRSSVNNKFTEHNADDGSHNDIRLLITGLTERLNALANSTDEDLDQMAEIVAYIKSNKSLIDSITDTKVNVADIINNLTTNVSNKPLSAAQGVELRNLINAITVPTKLSELSADSTHRLVTDTEKAAWNNKSDFSGKYADLSGKPTIPTVPTNVSTFTNDAGYLTSYTETDPTVPSWAKASSKPSYTKSEVGLSNVENVKQYSASNPPPYPVTSVNGKTGAVTITVPTKTSELTNNSGFLTSHQDISGKADKSSAETWTFTLKSGGTVTKKVVLA